jgi:ubiquitin related modifier 1
MKITVEFSGGLELLFDKKKNHSLEFPDDKSLTLRDLVRWIKDHLLKERAELFYIDDSVRPGILVLINDCDWELMDGIEYKLEPNDTIVFISTLHGG